MYLILNTTKQRAINFPQHKLATLAQARKTLHSVYTRKYCYILLINTNTMRVHAMRKSANSKLHFARNYFVNNYVVYTSANTLTVVDPQTWEVLSIINLT